MTESSCDEGRRRRRRSAISAIGGRVSGMGAVDPVADVFDNSEK